MSEEQNETAVVVPPEPKTITVLILGTDRNVGQDKLGEQLAAQLIAGGIKVQHTPTDDYARIRAGELPSLIESHLSKKHAINVLSYNGALSHPETGPVALALLYTVKPSLVIMCHAGFRGTQDGVSVQGVGLASEIANTLLFARRFNPDAKLAGINLHGEGQTEADLKTTIDETYPLGQSFGVEVFSFDSGSDDSELPEEFVESIDVLARKAKSR